MEIKKILITGAAGFIGYSLINRIISDNYDILGVDNINDYYNVNLKYARLDDLNIDAHKSKFGEVVVSSKYSNLRFIKLDITDNFIEDEEAILTMPPVQKLPPPPPPAPANTSI